MKMKLAKSILWSFPYSLRRLIVRTVRPHFYNTLQDMRTVETSRYSYKPFDEKKCIFVHIPKCAGVSISRTLFGNLAGGHANITKYQIIFSKHEFETYFKFAFVRNPWDRLVSAFHFFREGGMAKPDKIFAEKHLSAYRDFEDFVRRGLNLENLETTHFMPQYRFVCDIGDIRPKVDFIGFYENLREDFNYVRNRLDISANLKYQNKTSNRKIDYRDYYTDETIEIVANVYQKDIEIFGYDFDNSSLADQLTKRDTHYSV